MEATLLLLHRTATCFRSRCSTRFFRVCMSLIIAGILSCAAHARAEAGPERPPGSVKIIFFVPSDLTVPEGARHRITRIADTTDAFLFNGMNHHGYPPEVKTLFRRDSHGEVEVFHV